MKFHSPKLVQQIPMSLHYHNDGNGRDGYIQNDNGGFSVPNTFGKPGGNTEQLQLPGGGKARFKAMPTTTRPFHYNQDGTGRDSYVYASHHGEVHLSPHHKQVKSSFYN